MSDQNGRLPQSSLKAIHGGQLRKDAARAWHAMRYRIHGATGVWIEPEGPNGTYRTYAEQVKLWDLYKAGKGNLAAEPGTSNHGWGIAVDLKTRQMADLINKYGAPYGWQKRWSDAPSEWWHFKWRSGVYTKVRVFFALLKHR